MKITVKNTAASTTKAKVLVVFATNKKLSAAANELNKALDGALAAMHKRATFSGEAGTGIVLPTPAYANAEAVVLAGVPAKGMTALAASKVANYIASTLHAQKLADAAIFVDAGATDDNGKQLGLIIARELVAKSYTPDMCKSGKRAKADLKRVALISDDTKVRNALKASAEQGAASGLGHNEARELGDLPGNICTPTFLANRAKAMAKATPKLTTKILDEKQMKALGMNSLLSVSQGSAQPAKLIIMEYKGGKKDEKPTVLVGKGLTFDSGGISIKPGAAMDEMKYDMGGAAAVFGAMVSAIELGLKSNIVAVVAAAENMPSSTATKPGDIFTSMKGLTIEVLNTDAEGRLVLCDALTYVERYKPKAVIDLATLTGACVIALGSKATGLYANDQKLANRLLEAGESTFDRAWQMPLWDEYQPMLKSNFADLANIGGREAGSVTAACFLSRFAEEYNWAHLDIAGSAWQSGANKGATGRPVSLLIEYLKKHA